MKNTIVFVALALVLVVAALLISAGPSEAVDGKKECREACRAEGDRCIADCGNDNYCKTRCVDFQIACMQRCEDLTT